MKHREIITQLGGPSKVAAALGVLPTHTTIKWQTRGIPAARWPDIIRLATERGMQITPDELRAGHPSFSELATQDAA